MTQPGAMKLIENRECGACFACCKILNIDSGNLQKPADVLCSHYQHGTGCTIYDTRPKSCRDYFCVWRFEKALPDDFNPSNLHIMFALEQSPRDPRKPIVVGRAYEADYERVFNSDNARRAFDVLMEAGYEVWLSSGVIKAPLERGKPLPTFSLTKKMDTPRNAPCPCGSGKRYKACCGNLIQ